MLDITQLLALPALAHTDAGHHTAVGIASLSPD
jgi:hypothetical protein